MKCHTSHFHNKRNDKQGVQTTIRNKTARDDKQFARHGDCPPEFPLLQSGPNRDLGNGPAEAGFTAGLGKRWNVSNDVDIQPTIAKNCEALQYIQSDKHYLIVK
jgi:hypothetical protein